MDIVESFFSTIGTTIQEFFTVLTSGIDNVVKLFYTTPTAEQAYGSFTFLGTLLMIGLGVGLVWTLIKWISGIVRNVAR